jgi:hypothetical protein
MPVLSMVFVIHLLAAFSIVDKIRSRLGISTACGLVGVIFLHISIRASSDTEAVIGYLAAVIVFCAFAAIGFFVSTTYMYAYSCAQKSK